MLMHCQFEMLATNPRNDSYANADKQLKENTTE